MNASDSVLKALPLDATPDSGPRRRVGTLALIVLLSLAFSALSTGLGLQSLGNLSAALVCLALFLVSGGIAAAVLFARVRQAPGLPRSHAVLSDHFGFRLNHTCRGVGTAVFLHGDKLNAGAATQLLCFFENYCSRQRVVHLTVGPHADLGLAETHVVDLHLAAGQAAVYVLPLVLSQTIRQGEHDIPVAIETCSPTGRGAYLPGAPRHLHNLWTMHMAAPFTVEANTAASTEAQAPLKPSYHSLASVSAGEPDLQSFLAKL